MGFGHRKLLVKLNYMYLDKNPKHWQSKQLLLNPPKKTFNYHWCEDNNCFWKINYLLLPMVLWCKFSIMKPNPRSKPPTSWNLRNMKLTSQLNVHVSRRHSKHISTCAIPCNNAQEITKEIRARGAKNCLLFCNLVSIYNTVRYLRLHIIDGFCFLSPRPSDLVLLFWELRLV